jgi:hypothetical protein
MTLGLSNNNVYLNYTTDITIKAIQSSSPEFSQLLSTDKSLVIHPVLQAHSPDAARNQYLAHRNIYPLVGHYSVLMNTSDSASLCL